MSIKLMTAVWERSKHDGSELLVLLALADMANEEGVCWPGKNNLAHKARMSTRNLNRILNKLTESGELIVMHRPRIGQSWQTNVYKVCPPLGDVDVTQGVTPMSPRGDVDVPPSGQIRPNIGTLASPKSSFNRQEKREGIVTANAAKSTPFDPDDISDIEEEMTRRAAAKSRRVQ